MNAILDEKSWLKKVRGVICGVLRLLVVAVSLVVVEAGAVDVNPQWSSMGGMPGTNGPVYCSTVDGAGRLYVGGGFTIISNVKSYGVAMWDGTKWTSMSGSASSGCRVEAMASDARGNLYVGGNFTEIGGVPALRIAKWDGTKWVKMGAGLGFNGAASSHKVKAIAVSPTGVVYAAGIFTDSNGVIVNNVARWNGTAWKPLGAGLIGSSPEVNALAFDASGTLYATGKFTYSGNTQINYIAKWNGSAWSNVGGGLSGFPYEPTGRALKLDGNGNLVVAGLFKSAGSLQVNNIARWNGRAWSAFGKAGVDAGFEALSDGIQAVGLTPGGNVVAASRGAIVGDTVTYELVRWNGTSWVPAIPHPAVGRLIRTFQILANGEYVLGGDFKELGTGSDAFHASQLVRWSGGKFRRYGSGPDAKILAAKFDANNHLIVAGSFQTIGNIEANRIARFDGTRWWPYATGLDGDVFCLALGSNGQLYAGGKFNRAGLVDSKCVAKWDGSQWVTLAGGVSQVGTEPVVRALALASDGSLYAGGEFGLSVSNVALSGVGRWRNGAWSALDGGARTIDGTQRNGSIVSLLIDGGGGLLASGYFERMGSNTTTNTGYLARWSGNVWSPVGPTAPEARFFDFNRGIDSMALSPTGVLYVGSDDTVYGTNSIQRLMSNVWQPLGSGLSGGPNCYAFNSSGGVVVGGITTLDTLRGITYWNGSVWSSFGTKGLGLHNDFPEVHALAVDANGNMIVGGEFFGSYNGVVSPYLIKSRLP